jgi:hypothetical protein
VGRVRRRESSSLRGVRLEGPRGGAAHARLRVGAANRGPRRERIRWFPARAGMAMAVFINMMLKGGLPIAEMFEAPRTDQYSQRHT